MSDHDQDAPKLHIDSDWKAQAQAEKERLAEKEQAKAATSQTQDNQELPEASFQTLVDMLASQAVMGLGAMADPNTGKAMIDPQGSKFSIDLLAVIEEKTKGNLSDDESQHLTTLLSELRNRFVQIMDLVAKQNVQHAASATAQGNVGEDGGDNAGPGGGSFKLETP